MIVVEHSLAASIEENSVKPSKKTTTVSGQPGHLVKFGSTDFSFDRIAFASSIDYSQKLRTKNKRFQRDERGPLYWNCRYANCHRLGLIVFCFLRSGHDFAEARIRQDRRRQTFDVRFDGECVGHFDRIGVREAGGDAERHDDVVVVLGRRGHGPRPTHQGPHEGPLRQLLLLLRQLLGQHLLLQRRLEEDFVPFGQRRRLHRHGIAGEKKKKRRRGTSMRGKGD